jgi:hypothetical protein
MNCSREFHRPILAIKGVMEKSSDVCLRGTWQFTFVAMLSTLSGLLASCALLLWTPFGRA